MGINNQLSRYHILIKDLITGIEKGLMLDLSSGINYATLASIMPKQSQGEITSGDLLNTSVFAQFNWSGHIGQDTRTYVGPSGVKYWSPAYNYSETLPTGAYWYGDSLDTISIPGEIRLGENFGNQINIEGEIVDSIYSNGYLYLIKDYNSIYRIEDGGTETELVYDFSTDPRFLETYKIYKFMYCKYDSLSEQYPNILIYGKTNSLDEIGVPFILRLAEKTINGISLNNWLGRGYLEPDLTSSNFLYGNVTEEYNTINVEDIIVNINSTSNYNLGSYTFTSGGYTYTDNGIDKPYQFFAYFNGAVREMYISDISSVIRYTADNNTISGTYSMDIIGGMLNITDTSNIYIGMIVDILDDSGLRIENALIVKIDGNNIYINKSYNGSSITYSNPYLRIKNGNDLGYYYVLPTTENHMGQVFRYNNSIYRVDFQFGKTTSPTSSMDGNMEYHTHLGQKFILTQWYQNTLLVKNYYEGNNVLIVKRIAGTDTLPVTFNGGLTFYSNGLLSCRLNNYGGKGYDLFPDIGINSIYDKTRFLDNSKGRIYFTTLNQTLDGTYYKPEKFQFAVCGQKFGTAGYVRGNYYDYNNDDENFGKGFEGTSYTNTYLSIGYDYVDKYIYSYNGHYISIINYGLIEFKKIYDSTYDNIMIRDKTNKYAMYLYMGYLYTFTDSLIFSGGKYTPLPEEDYGTSQFNVNSIYINKGLCYIYFPKTSSIKVINIDDGSLLKEIKINNENIGNESLYAYNIFGYINDIYINTNLDNLVLKYEKGIYADKGYLVSSIYGGYLGTINKNWIDCRIQLNGQQSDKGQKIRLAVSFDGGITFKYLPKIFGLGTINDDFENEIDSNYEIGFDDLTGNKDKAKFYFPIESESTHIVYKLELYRGTCDVKEFIVNHIGVYYLLNNPKEYYINLRFRLSNKMQLLDQSIALNKHIELKNFIYNIRKNQHKVKITMGDGTEYYCIPFAPNQGGTDGFAISESNTEQLKKDKDNIMYSIQIGFKTIIDL